MGNRKEHIIENDIEKKHCPTCDKLKELNEFNKHFHLTNEYKQNKSIQNR